MPRYPFTPEILDALPEELAELFRCLERKLLQEICSRLKASGQLNEVTVQSIRALRAHGIDLKDIQRAIDEATGIGEARLNDLLNDVVARNQAYYMEMIDLAKVTEPETLLSHEDIWAIQEQTRGELRNLTRSMGFLVTQGRHRVMLPPAKAYQWALDSAELQIMSGAISYNQAITDAVRQLAESGLKTVRYESGHVDSLDVAIRRAVMTGVNQINQKYREQSMDYLGTDLVEVTAHLGARNIDGPMGWENHAAWQGKVYQWRKNESGDTGPAQQKTPSGSPALIQTIADASDQPTPRTALTPLDVTQEYLDAATPGQGAVTYDETFDKGRHQAEVSFAKWLHKMFGGDIRLLDEVNKDKVQTPDYIWRGKLWDLKTATTEKSANSAIRHGLRQIWNNPGGIILDYRGKQIDLSVLQNVIQKRLWWTENYPGMDIMVVLGDDDVRVWRYAEKK